VVSVLSVLFVVAFVVFLGEFGCDFAVRGVE